MNYSDIITIVLSAIVAGILSPIIINWIKRKQKGWKHKIIKDSDDDII